jgi:hypothetical protein
VIEELVAFHLAAALVTLYQLARSRDRRLVPLALLFAFLATGFHLGCWDGLGRLFLYAAGVCGLVLLLSLTPRTRAGSS